MLALQLLAITFLGLSAALMFGPQVATYGPRMARDMLQDGQVQFVGGCLSSALLLVFLAPYAGDAFSSGGSAITLVMVDVFTMQFRPL
jgi:hypothetical protein